MTNQYTSPEVRAKEEALVREVLKLNDSVDVAYDNGGWDSRAYIVNGGETVFKFPRSHQVQKHYKQEVALLELIEANSDGGDVSVPRLRWKEPDLGYFGYEGIVGPQLSDSFGQINQDAKKAIGIAMGKFLRQLHALEYAELKAVNIEDEITEKLEKYDMAKPALADVLTPSEMKIVDEFILREFPATLRRLGVEPRLSHGDLGPWNIILKDNGQVGVIDFGDAAYFDVSMDFSALSDEVILENALDAYNADALLREKVEIRARAFPIFDLPFFLGKKDSEGTSACIALAKRTIIDGLPTNSSRFNRG